MQSGRSGGFRPLTAGMRARSVGSIYSTYTPTSPSAVGPLDSSASTVDTFDNFEDSLSEMGIESDVSDDYDYVSDVTNADGDGIVTSAEDEEAALKKKLMIAGGIGAVVIVAGIAVIAMRK